MTDKEFDKKIAEKLQGYREQAPEGMFLRIEESLKSAGGGVVPAPRRPLRVLLKYAAVAAILIGFIGTGAILTIKRDGVTEIPGGIVASDEVKIDQESMREVIERSVPVNEFVPQKSANGRPAADKGSRRVSDMIRETLSSGIGWEGSEENFGARINPTASDQTRYLNGGSNPERALKAIEEQRRLQQEARNREVENKWRNVLADNIYHEQKIARRRGIGLSVFAGNVGVGNGDINMNSLETRTAKNMQANEHHETGSLLTSAGSSYVRPFDLGDTQNPTLRHRMPITAGVTISLPLSERWSIVTGINYSYLYSETNRYGSAAGTTYRDVQRLHFIGVPVSARYSLYSTRNANFYLRSGFMLEKAVYAAQNRHIYMDSGDTHETYRLKMRGFQPSVDAAIGASIRIAEGINLYLEPGIAYYFISKDQMVRDYRTENPTSFSLKVGVRFGAN